MNRLETFLAARAAETYPEPPRPIHDDITAKMLPLVMPLVPRRCQVLDVGCGQGVALKHFAAMPEVTAVGISINDDDLAACRRQRFTVRHMDQNNLELPDDQFDLIWARHVLEHSPIPFFTLTEFHRVLKPGAILYAEMPAPDTECKHETNPNHYSVLGSGMWINLLSRAGFRIETFQKLTFCTPAGEDLYFIFLCRK